VYRNRRPRLAAAFQPKSRNRKISPVSLVERGDERRLEPVAVGPYVCTTHVSMAATCPRSCPFFASGCYARAGAARRLIDQLDIAARQLRSREVIEQEAELIRRAFGGGPIPRDGGRDGTAGRDLRLHVAGDVRTPPEARILADAARKWVARGGGAVWTYTHRWATVPRSAWGPIRVLASIEDARDTERAHARGYDAAIVLPAFVQDTIFTLPATKIRVLPCPAQTRKATCVECRACFGSLRERRLVIGFRAHGPTAVSARRALPVIQPARSS
jgi:hypothetical protein